METYQAALDTAITVAREAGDLLRAEFHRGGGPRGEAGHAAIDVEAEWRIRARLLEATSWSYLGEETGAEWRDSDHLWLVDPNDGTRDFLEGARGSAVSIAALCGGVPVLGVVYAFAFPDDEGDLIAWAEGCGAIRRNGQPVSARLGGGLDARSVVLVSHQADRCPSPNARCVAPARYRALPSVAYRLALVAAGERIAAVSLNSPGAWDYAGGHALVRAAGGVLLDESGQEVSYARDGRSSTRWCFGGAPEAARTLVGSPWETVFEGPRDASFAFERLDPGRAATDAATLSRAHGGWLGQIVGDALGELVEFEGPAEIARRYPDGVRDIEDGGTWNTIAGQPTDDSELATMLARSILIAGGYEAALALDGYVHWYRSGPFDIGSTTSQALGAASQAPTGGRIAEVDLSANRESQANGSLMRVSPLGILAWRSPGAGAAWAREDSGLTHPNPVCRESCAAYVAAIGNAISSGDASAAWEAALHEARSGRCEPVVRAIEEARDRPPASFVRQQGWVLIALQNAFYRLLHAASFEEALVATVGEGGDTDTNGAIAGALLGAALGREAIPWRWRERVLTCRPLAGVGARRPRPMEFWPVDALVVAEKLLLLGQAFPH